MVIRQTAQETSLEPEARVSQAMAEAASPLSNTPQTDGTVTQSHRVLLNHYKLQTQEGQWHTIPADGYIHAHLTWHLEQAGAWDELHQLLQAETPTGQNAWYLACDRAQTPGTFPQDIARALRLAQAQFAENPAQVIALQCYYALILSSLYSQTQNLPAQLIAALVKQRIWTSDQGLDYAEHLEFSDRQASVLKALAPYLPDTQIPIALEIAYRLEDEYYKALSLSAFISSHLQADQLIEMLEAAQQMEDESCRVLVLKGLVAYFPQRELSRVLRSVRQIQDNEARAELLSHLVLRCPVLLPETLTAIREISDPFAQVECFSWLAPHFPDVLPETLAIANQIQPNHTRALALSALASTISERFSERFLELVPELVPEIFESLQTLQSESSRALVLNSLALQGFPKWQSQALNIARQFQDASIRALVLCNFVLDDAELLIDAKETAHKIPDRAIRARTLSHLAIQFPNVLPEALTATAGLQSRSVQADILSQLAIQFPQVLGDAIVAIDNLSDLAKQTTALGKLAIPYPELWPRVFQTLRTIPDLDCRTTILDEFALALPQTYLDEAVAIAQQLHDESTYASALTELATYLPKSCEQTSSQTPCVLNPCVLSPLLSNHHPSQTTDTTASPCKRCAENLKIVQTLQNPFLSAQVLCSMISQLDCSRIGIEHLQKLLEILAHSYRTNVLHYIVQLTPTFFALGETKALVGVMKSIQTVTRQWP